MEAGKVRWMLHDADGNDNFTLVSDAVVASDEWVHIAGTYNSTTSEAKIFVNAKEMGNTTVVGKGTFACSSFTLSFTFELEFWN